MTYTTHRDLKVWNEAMELVCELYKVTKDYPKSEQYGLITQIRRTAISVLANISEGAARSSTKEFIHFLTISRGSLSELESEVLISEKLHHLNKENSMQLLDKILDKIEVVGKQLSGLIRSLRKKL